MAKDWIEIKLPELGEGVTEGELVKWLVQPGDSVKHDQPIVEILTDKATMEVPSTEEGVVQELKFQPGDRVEIKSTLLTLAPTAATLTQSQTTHQAQGQTHQTQTTPQSQTYQERTYQAQTYQAQTDKDIANILPPADLQVLVSPATRKLARELKIDVNKVPGTGPSGRITREDVLLFTKKQLADAPSSMTPSSMASSSMASSPVTPPSMSSSSGAAFDLTEKVEKIPLRGIRKKIAENMRLAKSTIPHFTLMDEACVSILFELRENLKDHAQKRGSKVTYLPFVMKAIIHSCQEFPMLNATLDENAGEIIYRKYFHLGFAADTPNGLMVPVIKNAHLKSIFQISKEIQDLSLRAREGKLKSEEMKGATISITNIGSIGGTYATPIINPPEVAILGMYKIHDKLVLKDQQVVSEKMMNLTITADHRLIDGAVAARFLRSVIQKLENPGQLMLDLI